MDRQIKVKTPGDSASLLLKYAKCKIENFGIILLDGGNNVIKVKRLFIGGYNASLVDIRVVLYEAIKNRSIGVILFHNHPSGDFTPSKIDIETTKRLKKALNICGIQLLDHVIISKEGYYSFALHNLVINDAEEELLKVATK